MQHKEERQIRRYRRRAVFPTGSAIEKTEELWVVQDLVTGFGRLPEARSERVIYCFHFVRVST
jgi:hypothetical protein